MRTQVLLLELTAKKTCYVSLPSQFASELSAENVCVLSVQGEGPALYVSWQGEVTSGRQEALEINGLFAAKHGLQQGQEIPLKFVPRGPINNIPALVQIMAWRRSGDKPSSEPIMVSVSVVPSVPSCTSVSVEPLSVDDWEILELHAAFIESHLLDQVRVVWPGQVLPVWVQNKICVFLSVDHLEPAGSCAILEQHTEVLVSPKLRRNVTTGVNKVPPTPGTSGDTATVRGTPSDGRSQLSQEQSAVGEHGTRSRKYSNGGIAPSQSISSGDPERTNTTSSGLFGWVWESARSWWSGSDNGDPSSPANDTLVYQPEVLSSSWEAALRVQPFGQLAHHQTLRYHSSRKGKTDKLTQPHEHSDKRPINIAHQPCNVYISRETYLSHFKHVCDTNHDEKLSFLAHVFKLSSPLDKEEEMKKKASVQRSKKKLATLHKKDLENTSILDAVENDQPKGVIVRVVVLCDNKYRLWSQTGSEMGRVQFLPSHGALQGHVIVPDLLRRQHHLDVTGRVRIQSLSETELLQPSGITLLPLFKPPSKFTKDMMLAAFKMWLTDVTCIQFPLVASEGTLVKFFLKKDYFGEFLLNFTHPSTNTTTTVPPSGCFMLTSDSLQGLELSIGEQLTAQSRPQSISRLPSWSVGELDPPVPDVTVEQLGGVAPTLESLHSRLSTGLSVTPLTQHLFDSCPGTQIGGTLVCGAAGSGKSVLCRAAARRLTQPPYLAHVTVVNCKPLRGKRAETIHQQWQKLFNEASWRQPAVIIFDDLEHIAGAASGPEQEMSGEAQYCARIAQVLKTLLLLEQKEGSHVVVMVTCRSRSSLHPTLVDSRGHHLFPHTVDISAPDQSCRVDILRALLLGKTCVAAAAVDSVDLHKVAAQTEGYMARDLDLVVERAIHAHWMDKNLPAGSKDCHLTDANFEVALHGFTPASLRGIDLHKTSDVGWSDVGGLNDVKKTLVETLQWPSKYPELFKHCPLRLRSGLLLYGAPGTGKTLLAAAVARECGLNFISIKGPELLSKYIGASEQEVRNTFERAQSAKPCVLFFDEFDSLAPRRGHDSTGVTDRVVNQLLTQLDGVEGLEGVYVLAATSRPDLIDPALLRPGRLDRSLLCDMPDQADRLSILQALTQSLVFSEGVDLQYLAQIAVHYTGADLKALLYNAQLAAIHETTAKLRGQTVPEADQHTDSSDGELREPYEVVTPQSVPKMLGMNEFQVSPPEKPVQVHPADGTSVQLPLSDSSVDDLSSLPVEHSRIHKVSDGSSSTSFEDLGAERKAGLSSDGQGSSDENTHINEHHLGGVAASGWEEEVAMVIEKPPSSRQMVFIPKLEDGVVELTEEQEQQLLAKLSLPDNTTETTSVKEKSHSPISIRMEHLLQAFQTMSPSVSEGERRRYQDIYENFVSSRGGNFSKLPQEGMQKATLA